MIEEILKTIDQKKETEINKIEDEKEAQILALRGKAKKEIAKKKSEALLALNKEKSNQISEFLQKKETELDFILQEEKNKIIEEVWDQVEGKIKKMPDDSFEKIIKFLIKFIPNNIEGEIKASERTAKILKRSLKNFKIKDDLKEEGFLVKTKNLDLDFRIKEVLKQMREDLNPKIIKILF